MLVLKPVAYVLLKYSCVYFNVLKKFAVFLFTDCNNSILYRVCL